MSLKKNKDQLEVRPAKLDTSRLKVGVVVSGYKGMCEVLGVRATTGKSRKQQEEDWRRYFEWEEDNSIQYGRRITHIKEYPDLLPPPENSLYIKFIEMAMVYLLSEQKALEIEMTYPKWFEALGMANKNYKFIREDIAKEIIGNQIRRFNPLSYEDFDRRSRNRLKRKMQSALNSMQRRKLIIWNEELYCIVEADKEDEPAFLYDYSQPKRKKENNLVHAKATAQDRSVWTEVSRRVLVDNYQCDSVDELRRKAGEQACREYEQEVSQQLYDLYRIVGFYTMVRVSYDCTTMGKAIEPTKALLEEQAAKYDLEVVWDELSNNLVDMLDNDAKSKQANASKKLSGFIRNQKGEVIEELPDSLLTTGFFETNDYLIEQQIFSRYFISRNPDVKMLRKQFGNGEYSEDEDKDLDLGI